MLARILLCGLNLFDCIYERKNVVQSARIGMEMLAADIRRITASSQIISADSTSLSFLDSNSEEVTYSYSEGVLHRNGHNLVDGLSSFSFVYYDDAGNQLSVPVYDVSQIWMIRFGLEGRVNDQLFSFQLSVAPRTF